MLNQPYIPEIKPTKSQRNISYTNLHTYSKVSEFYNFMFRCWLAYFRMCFIFPFFFFFTILLSISRRSCSILGIQDWQYFRIRRGINAAKMTVKKCNAKDRKCVFTERKCSCKDTGEIFCYISIIITTHYAAWSANTSVFMSMH